MKVLITLVYTQCTQGKSFQLWESLYEISHNLQNPWLVGKDFNVITNDEEKLGGLLVRKAEVRDYNHCINMCVLKDRGFKSNKYPWWNERTGEECIFKRLDRVLCNNKIHNIFSIDEVEHLVRSTSDHAHNENVTKSFRFLNFWIKEESFMEVFK